GFDYVALGHLHRAQNPALNVRYSGTPLCYSFSEARQKKSFTLLDTVDLSIREIPIQTARGLRIVKGKFEQILEQAPWDSHREDYLKIELTDCFAGLERLELLRQYYPNLLLLTGKTPEGHEAGGLTVEELTSLLPRDLVGRFYSEMTGEEPDEELLNWFEQAAGEVEEVEFQ
ncbi:MAG: exonuclease SbcCD subunit D C-terminal domain-containing protein, partial [Oscillospiraceae bacterium]|nr:exonuclease SbcCD subunit D C-terminal domain-containing protein [Oscillospiraceae bacterium]